MKRLLIAAILLLPAPALADEITDTLQSAIEAYEAGDVQFALEELAFAQQMLQAMRAESLTDFLPPAPEGWTREVNTAMNAGLAMMGGGTGAEAEYRSDGTRIRITLMADNPMVAAMAGLFRNPVLMAASGRITRVGRQKFIDQDGELTGVVDNRILVQASGAEIAQMVSLLESIDYEGLARFGR